MCFFSAASWSPRGWTPLAFKVILNQIIYIFKSRGRNNKERKKTRSRDAKSFSKRKRSANVNVWKRWYLSSGYCRLLGLAGLVFHSSVCRLSIHQFIESFTLKFSTSNAKNIWYSTFNIFLVTELINILKTLCFCVVCERNFSILRAKYLMCT